MGSFHDLPRHFGALPPGTVASLTSIAEARGMAEVLPRQNPAGLETLRRVAMIQSTEASNAIENIHAPRARIAALGADTGPRALSSLVMSSSCTGPSTSMSAIATRDIGSGSTTRSQKFARTALES